MKKLCTLLILSMIGYMIFKTRKPKYRTIADDIAAYKANPLKEDGLLYRLIAGIINSGKPFEMDL